MSAAESPLARATVSELSITVRPASPDEAEAVAALVHTAYRSEESRQGWTSEAHLVAGRRTDPESVRDLAVADAGLVLAAVTDDDPPALVACCHLEHRGTSAYLGMFAVQPRHQGQGIGHLVLEAAEAYARDTWGVPTLEISVLNHRPELVAWYERCGFTLTGHSHPFPYDDARFGIPQRPDLELLAMAKRLPA